MPISGRKRLIDAVPHGRKPRSKILRRKRFSLLPFFGYSFNQQRDTEDDADSVSSCVRSALSTDSSLAFARSEASNRSRAPSRVGVARKGIGNRSGGILGEESRPITRWYSRQQEKLRSFQEKENNSRGVEGTAISEIAISEVSQASGVCLNDDSKKKANSSASIEKSIGMSESSCLASVSKPIAEKIPESTNPSSTALVVGTEDEPYALDLCSDLACSEQLSIGMSEYSNSNEMTLSDFESELFGMSSCEGNDSSDFSFVESADDFSERSCDSAPSAAFAALLQLARQFSGSQPRAEPKAPAGSQEYSPQEFTFLRFKEEDEESYTRFRSRERKEVVVRDYAEEYSFGTDCGSLITHQRLMMVNWILEHAKALELHSETLFLGVNLMDRFLSRGYFSSERNLQLLGIACVTLATRIEENQPHNRVRQKSFMVGSNVYSRCEVVAMEWLVQEILDFKCFLPTIHHFLWFYLKAAKADAEVESLARQLAVLSLLDHEHLSFWPSTVAAGLVILASLAVDRDDSCQLVMETHVRTKNDDLPECIQSLEWLVQFACLGTQGE